MYFFFFFLKEIYFFLIPKKDFCHETQDTFAGFILNFVQMLLQTIGGIRENVF